MADDRSYDRANLLTEKSSGNLLFYLGVCKSRGTLLELWKLVATALWFGYTIISSTIYQSGFFLADVLRISDCRSVSFVKLSPRGSICQ
jgi:hypothetical protein